MSEKKEIIFKLIDKDGWCVSEFRCSDLSEASITGTLYNIVGWGDDKKNNIDYEFISDVYMKWDACSHFYFYGEDYKKGNDKSNSYYHICGCSGYYDFMRGIAFVYEIARKNMNLYDAEEFDKILELNLLEGCTIEKIQD